MIGAGQGSWRVSWLDIYIVSELGTAPAFGCSGVEERRQRKAFRRSIPMF